MKLKFWIFLGCTALLGATAVQAQERSAGGPVETQMTWVALKSLVDSVGVKVDGLTARVNQGVECGKLGKLYAPGGPGADGMGCKTVEDARVTNLINTVNTLNSNFSNLQTTFNTSNVTNIASCSKVGMIYAPAMPGADSKGCVTPVTGKDCVMNQVTACGGVGNCVTQQRVWSSRGANYINTTVPTTWKDGDTYIWHYASTQNDYGGGQCVDGKITFFTTGH